MELHGVWQLKRYFQKTVKSRWRRRYLKKAFRPDGKAQITRLVLAVALAVALAAELIYGAGIIIRNPGLIFETLGIQVISETREGREWTIKGAETHWGIRVGAEGIELYREEKRIPQR